MRRHLTLCSTQITVAPSQKALHSRNLTTVLKQTIKAIHKLKLQVCMGEFFAEYNPHLLFQQYHQFPS